MSEEVCFDRFTASIVRARSIVSSWVTPAANTNDTDNHATQNKPSSTLSNREESNVHDWLMEDRPPMLGLGASSSRPRQPTHLNRRGDLSSSNDQLNETRVADGKAMKKLVKIQKKQHVSNQVVSSTNISDDDSDEERPGAKRPATETKRKPDVLNEYLSRKKRKQLIKSSR